MQRARRRKIKHPRSLLATVAMALLVPSVAGPAVAQSQIVPMQKRVDVDWPSVARDVPDLAAPPRTVDSEAEQALARYAFKDKKAIQPLARLNAFLAATYPGLPTVPVPVLAPVDASRYVGEFARGGSTPRDAAQSFLLPAITKMQFLAKTTGYDAILTVNRDLLRQHDIADVELAQVHLGGTGLLYEPEPQRRGAGPSERGALIEDDELRARYPGLRRHVGEDEITYNFMKYRVPYFASLACQHEKRSTAPGVPCPQADAILRAVLLDLRLIGGAPLAPLAPAAPRRRADTEGPPRPTTVSPDFKFHPPGTLIARATSQDGLGGVTTRIRWAPNNFIFPLKANPAFANSQLFMHGGDCFHHKIPLSGGRYKCEQNPGKILEDRESHAENYAYPWFDTYCEVRDDNERQPKDCPARRKAHEGQDIRPLRCDSSNGKCKIDLFEVIAVTKGKAWWTAQNHLRLIANDGTNLYYMYMHMSPTALAAAEMKLGEAVDVEQGRKVGAVGNWLKTEPGATTAHLHFEIRKQTEMCGSYGCPSSPYWTLVLAYELLINMRGTEITP
jgi:hypothetical protein